MTDLADLEVGATYAFDGLSPAAGTGYTFFPIEGTYERAYEHAGQRSLVFRVPLRADSDSLFDYLRCWGQVASSESLPGEDLRLHVYEHKLDRGAMRRVERT